MHATLQGWTALGHRLREWAKLAGKAVIAVSLLMGLVPLLFGLLLELVVLTPVRVPLHQSPIYFLWQVTVDSCLSLFEEITRETPFPRTGPWEQCTPRSQWL